MVNKLFTLSLGDIYKLEYEDEGLGVYRWIHPKMILGYDPEDARALAIERDLEDPSSISAQNEFEDTPDTLITDYLANSLTQREEYIKKGEPLPGYCKVTPMEYIDALLYLIIELGSSYACYKLGSTHYHSDEFLSPQYARPILECLRLSLEKSSDRRTRNLIRDLISEIFHVAYPWNPDMPRFYNVLEGEEVAFLVSLAKVGPY